MHGSVRRDEGSKARDGWFEISTVFFSFRISTSVSTSHSMRIPPSSCEKRYFTSLGISLYPSSIFTFLTPNIPLPRFQMMNKLVRVTERPQEPRYGDTPALRALLIEINPLPFFSPQPHLTSHFTPQYLPPPPSHPPQPPSQYQPACPKTAHEHSIPPPQTRTHPPRTPAPE